MFSCYSCEDVIDNIDLQNSKERLVIEALIEVKRGTEGKNQTIKLSKTTPFYVDKAIPATGAVVTISNDKGVVRFTESKNGIYNTTDFTPQVNTTYVLRIEYNNEVYTATETYKEVPSINEITQSNKKGDSELSEVNIEFRDIEEVDNFYRIKMHAVKPNKNISKVNINEVFKDEYRDGKKIDAFFEDEDIKKGDKLVFRLYGISEQFFNYMELISLQTESGGGGLFGTPAANVRGNCINITNKENYPYGYFSISQYDIKEYEFK